MENEACGREAARWLLSLGCRRVLVIGDSMGISGQQEMMDGIRGELDAAGLTPVETLRVNPQRTTEAIAALEKALSSGLEPDAVLCTTSRLTVGALRVLKDRNIPPERTGVLGIGEHRLHRYGLIDYLAVREPLTEMAGAAARSLLKLQDDRSLSGREMTFPCTCLR